MQHVKDVESNCRLKELSNTQWIYQEYDRTLKQQTKHLLSEAELYEPPEKMNYFQKRIEYQKIKEWKNITHHPICFRYRNHFFTFGSIHVCVGCFSMGLAIILLSLSYMVLGLMNIQLTRTYLIALLVMFNVGLIAPLLHLFLKPDRKIVKTVSRFVAGLGFASYYIIMFETQNILIIILMAAISFAAIQLYGKLRHKGNKSYCKDCFLWHRKICDPWKSTKIKMKKYQKVVNN